MNKTVLECKNLKQEFTVGGKTITVLKGISFSVNQGESIVIRGRSGAGKSILLWLLCGLEQPTSGEVLFEGQPLGSLTNSRLADLRHDKIGIIFQNFNLIASWTALENVESALLHSNLTMKERRQKAAEILAELGLGERLNNLPAELSIGEQQRVAVARTLINEPALVLADEPTGDVDPETAREIIQMLKQPVRERDASLLITTHGNFPLKEADRILTLENGLITSQER